MFCMQIGKQRKRCIQFGQGMPNFVQNRRRCPQALSWAFSCEKLHGKIEVLLWSNFRIYLSAICFEIMVYFHYVASCSRTEETGTTFLGMSWFAQACKFARNSKRVLSLSY